MTGFGTASVPLGHGRLTVEVRSLNHKHTDVRLRLPPELSEHGSFMEQIVRPRVGRGRFDVTVRTEGRIGGHLEVDEDRLRSLYASLCRIRDTLAPDSRVSLSHLASLPELLSSKGPREESIHRALTEAFEAAHVALVEMRKSEGAALLTDLSARLTRLTELRKELEKGSEDLVAHHRDRLRERVEHLLAPSRVPLERDRLEQEIALIADRSDITEELVRLDSHFAQMSTFLQSNEAVGRRLDFLLQEIGREVNTVGSKSQHAKVSHLVVEMKSEVERLREQVQNVD